MVAGRGGGEGGGVVTIRNVEASKRGDTQTIEQ